MYLLLMYDFIHDIQYSEPKNCAHRQVVFNFITFTFHGMNLVQLIVATTLNSLKHY